MTQVFNQIKKSTVFAALLLTTVFMFSNCTKDSAGISASLNYSLSGSASGSQARPASSNSNGSGNFTGTYNAGSKIMNYTTTWTNLSGAPINGGLYAGATGQIGTSISLWTLGSGLSTSGSFSSTTTLNAEQEAQLLAGKLYYVLGTAANASGEIRGQISASVQ